MRWIDSHCHLDFSPLNEQRQQVEALCLAAGVTQVIVPGVAPDKWAQQIEFCQSARQLRCYYALGLHPWWAQQDWLAPNAQQLAGAIAIGECGLDGAIEIPLERQLEVLTPQLILAAQQQLPLILHCRRLHQPLIQALDAHKGLCGGVLHGFSGSYALAKQFVDRGFRIGVGGTITYPSAQKTCKTLQKLGVEHWLLETDAPAMPLFGWQGQANSPGRIVLIAEQAAQLAGLSLEVFAEQMWRNACATFPRFSAIN